MAVSGPEAIDPAPGQGRNAVEGGRARLFCFAMQRRRSRRRKKAGTGRCGWAIETKSSPGHTQSIETALGAPMTPKRKAPGLAPSSVAFKGYADVNGIIGSVRCCPHGYRPARSADVSSHAMPHRPIERAESSWATNE